MPYKWKDKKQEYHKAYHAEWYRKNQTKVIKQKRERINSNKKWFLEYKSSLSCKTCGASHPAILDFHHRDGKEKDNVIADMVGDGRNKQRICDEIAKCDALCSNCHRILHYSLRGRHDMWVQISDK